MSAICRLHGLGWEHGCPHCAPDRTQRFAYHVMLVGNTKRLPRYEAQRFIGDVISVRGWWTSHEAGMKIAALESEHRAVAEVTSV